MKSFVKQIITTLLLISFLTIALFSFTAVIHGPDARMSGGCPFSAIDPLLCPQNVVAIVFHHISAYQSYINIPVGSGITAVITSLLLVAGIIFLISIGPPLFRPLALAGISYDTLPDTPYRRKIIRWLALHEHSPSL